VENHKAAGQLLQKVAGCPCFQGGFWGDFEAKMGILASLERFERSTRCLEGSRSIQLSYRDKLTLLKI
jgi:hypothetical protein